MARSRNPAKRDAILREAKKLFATDGFDATSMGGLAKASALPVGSIYTYFPNKEAIVQAIVEEGWGEFVAGLESGIAAIPDPEAKLSYLVRNALPALFVDVDLITILLSEAGKAFRLGEKLDHLALIVTEILSQAKGPAARPAPKASATRAGVAVFLLGSLDTVRLTARAGLEIGAGDIIDFVSEAAEAAFGAALPARRGFPT